MLFFIAAELIAVPLVFGAGFLNGSIDGLETVPPWIIAGAGAGLVLTIIHWVFRAFRWKTGNVLFAFSEAALLLGLLPGSFLYAELLNLDQCHRWMAWFGSSLAARLFTVLAVLTIASVALTAIAFLIRLRPLRVVVLILPLLLPAALYLHGLSVCTKSYSDYMTANLTVAQPVEEYELKRDADIYYPSFLLENTFPMLLPEGYAEEGFSKGDVVYLLYSMKAAQRQNWEYVPVSDGEKAGFVKISELRKLSAPQNEYAVATLEKDTPVYEEEVFDTRVLPLAGGSGKAAEECVLSTLPKGEKLAVKRLRGDYLEVLLSDGTSGYVARESVAVVKQPLP